MATTQFCKHPVSEYTHWKRGYDVLGPFRQEKGMIGASVHRDIKDPNILVITHRFPDAQAMMAFVNSDELREAMGNAGVIGVPEFWFADDVEQTEF
jgi:hypothetical protein